MAHLHEKIDFTVAIFVVRDGRILLVHHRNLDQWRPLGGPIELDEDPETAAYRSVLPWRRPSNGIAAKPWRN
jgi:ADP-ribose pyrophosphatase YjhB (NUDIX family)